jgi:hypothetical protein
MIQNVLNKIDPRVGLIFALTLLFVGAAHAGEFHYDSATHSIEMKGTILVGDGEKFSSLLQAHPDTENVELSASLGGEYTSSLAMSLEVKKRGLNTVSENYCHSGCAYIWLAGATREVIGSANPEIHLPYANATHEAFPKLTYAWFGALGLSSTFADAVVQSVGPTNSFVKLTPAFIAKFGGSKGQDA